MIRKNCTLELAIKLFYLLLEGLSAAGYSPTNSQT